MRLFESLPYEQPVSMWKQQAIYKAIEDYGDLLDFDSGVMLQMTKEPYKGRKKRMVWGFKLSKELDELYEVVWPK
ncbi:MAG: hypothetical protein EOM62_21620 [Bacteroidia bacterium]|nr:hypothetical protein [Bacteroidia bacterium]